MKIIQEKINQAIQILQEKNIDVWLTFIRETSAIYDPALSLIYGHDLTWQSALIITKIGECIAIVGRLEAEAIKRTGVYHTVIAYDQSIRPVLLDVIERLNPSQIAINYSTNDSHADGLSFGMYLTLKKYLNGTAFSDILISSEEVLGALRARKTQLEIESIKTAVTTTQSIYATTFEFMKPGMTEAQVGEFMWSKMVDAGVTEAWDRANCPAVNAGPDSPVGHSGPTNIKIKKGHIVHFDFGVKQNGYCSDIQRVVYFLDVNEHHPPEPIKKAFCTVVSAIQEAAKVMKPGITGNLVDTVARNVVTNAGYPEYLYATGHHLGRTTHDGSGILGPAWERYGETPFYLLEEDNVFTLEPGVEVPGYGYIGIEEDVLVTNSGAVFLSTPQVDLIVK